MDKQDFQEQDFMEILVRLPCRYFLSLSSPRRKCIVFAEAISLLREGSSLSPRRQKVLLCGTGKTHYKNILTERITNCPSVYRGTSGT